jgi:hypothetical protein
VELLRNATTELLASASMKAKFGELTIESPEFSLLETLLRGQAEQQANSTPSSESPEAVSLTKTWQTMIKDLTQEQRSESLQAAKEFRLVSRICGLIRVLGGGPSYDTRLFP